MLISHKHQFIFIKTQKTAGTAIEMALRKFMSTDDIVTPLHRKDEIRCGQLKLISPQNYRLSFGDYGPSDLIDVIKKRRLKRRFYGLMPAYEIKSEVPQEIWDQYLKVSVERNPYDKAISSYYWHNRRQHNPLSLSDWLRTCPAGQISNWNSYTIDERIVVDLVMMYEDLPNELIHLSERLKLGSSIELPTERPKGNVRKDRRPWHEVMDTSSMERIRQVCAKELEAFYTQTNP